jgi:uncharacterized membrane protein YhaH (DUF805 family)
VDGFQRMMERNVRPGRSYSGARAFILKSRIPRSEYTMNIFYIIGVVVVIIFVASFLGLHV